jgi:hypothetical protein
MHSAASILVAAEAKVIADEIGDDARYVRR